jgi:hypothetical protein
MRRDCSQLGLKKTKLWFEPLFLLLLALNAG